MKFCKSCGYIGGDNERECQYCGEKLVEKSSVKAKSEADDGVVASKSKLGLSRFADIVDNDVLFHTATLKLGGDARAQADAVEILRELAFRGHCDGMYRLADYLLSLDPPDEETAVMWLKIAAGSGHNPSKIRLRVLGVEKKGDSPLQIPDDESGLVARVRAVLPSVVTVTASFDKGNKTCWATGSGFIVEGGYVVTNAHVVTAKPKSITARFEPGLDDRDYNLTPLEIDVECDVAILRFTGLKDKSISEQDNLSLRVGDLQYGEEVYTVGNPLGLGLSVSRGVISCPNRESNFPSGVDHVIQTDITANHGNSGGALFDVNNNVVGMITYHPGDSEGGIAMCVPSDYIVKNLNKVK